MEPTSSRHMEANYPIERNTVFRGATGVGSLRPRAQKPLLTKPALTAPPTSCHSGVHCKLWINTGNIPWTSDDKQASKSSVTTRNAGSTTHLIDSKAEIAIRTVDLEKRRGNRVEDASDIGQPDRLIPAISKAAEDVLRTLTSLQSCLLQWCDDHDDLAQVIIRIGESLPVHPHEGIRKGFAFEEIKTVQEVARYILSTKSRREDEPLTAVVRQAIRDLSSQRQWGLWNDCERSIRLARWPGEGSDNLDDVVDQMKAQPYVDRPSPLDGAISLAPKRRTAFVWRCCTCGHSGNSITTQACPTCGAPRCAYCEVTKVKFSSHFGLNVG